MCSARFDVPAGSAVKRLRRGDVHASLGYGAQSSSVKFVMCASKCATVLGYWCRAGACAKPLAKFQAVLP